MTKTNENEARIIKEWIRLVETKTNLKKGLINPKHTTTYEIIINLVNQEVQKAREEGARKGGSGKDAKD